MPAAVSQVFVSHSTKDAKFVDPLVERLRDHYITSWYAPRNMPGGYFQSNIEQALAECDWFLIVFTPDSLVSDWVKREVDIAMKDPRFRNKVIPILAAPCDWKSIHQHMHRYQLFDYVKHPKEAELRLLRHLGVEPHIFPPVLVGDVKMPVYIFVGGDGETRFRRGDIECNGPGAIGNIPGPISTYDPPAVIKNFAKEYLPRRTIECRREEKVFVNNKQVRLCGASWGAANSLGGLDNRPLRLELGWTEYFHTAVTNMKTDERLPDGRTIGQAYAAPIDNLYACQLSNPIATNMSVVTSDNQIFYGQRSRKVQTLPGGYQPAISGDGQPEDIDRNGVYDPFHTAIREGAEECFGAIHQELITDITFFGLGRWMKTRFPFLFGEIRVGITAKQLLSMKPSQDWEGVRLHMPFTVEAVTSWVSEKYQDIYYGRSSWPIASPIFSLLQSLRYAYPQAWLEVVQKLDIPDIHESKQ
jgi:hypothetical protein